MYGLTQKQQDFVDNVIAGGCSRTEAAKRAGYAVPAVEACRLMQRPDIVQMVFEGRQRLIAGDLAGVAADTLREVMTDKTAPASARVAAARAVFEAAGHFGKKGGEPADPTPEWTEEQLNALLSRIDGAMANGAPLPVIKIANRPN